MYRTLRLAHFAELLDPAGAEGAWRSLSENPSPVAMEILRARPELIDWYRLSCNKAASLDLMELAPEPVGVLNWSCLSENPAMIPYLEKHMDLVSCTLLSRNPGAIPLLLAQPERINWSMLGENPAVMEFLADRRCAAALKIGWGASAETRECALRALGAVSPEGVIDEAAARAFDVIHAGLTWNPSLGNLMCEDSWQSAAEFRSYFWQNVSQNPLAVPFLEGNMEPDQLNWGGLAENPAATHLLRRFPGLIDWRLLCRNRSPEAMAMVARRLAAERALPGRRWFAVLLAPIRWGRPAAKIGAFCALCLASALANLVVWMGSWARPARVLSLDDSPSSQSLYRRAKNSSKKLCIELALSAISDIIMLPEFQAIFRRMDPSYFRVCWHSLAFNPAALGLFEVYPEQIRIRRPNLFRNPNPDAVRMVLDVGPEPDDHEIMLLSDRPEAVPYMEQHPLRRPNTSMLLRNPGAIRILEAKAREADDPAGAAHVRRHVLQNPGVFEEAYDYAAMRAAMDVHREGIAMAAFHPRRLAAWLAAGGEVWD